MNADSPSDWGGVIVDLRPVGDGKYVLVNQQGMPTRPLSEHEVEILRKRMQKTKRVRQEYEKDPKSNFLKPRLPGR